MNDLVISGVLTTLALLLLLLIYLLRARKASRYLYGVLIALLIADTAVFGQEFDAESAGARAAAWFTAAAFVAVGAVVAPMVLPLVGKMRSDLSPREMRVAGTIALVLCGLFAIAFMFVGIGQLRG